MSIVLLGAAILIPVGVQCWFDGLPLSRKAETLLCALLLPALLIACPRALSSRWLWPALIPVVAVKLLLWGLAPEAGWSVKVYESPAHRQQGAWERTYDTLWHPGRSTILNRPYSQRLDFPIEWINRYNDWEQRHSPDRPRFRVKPIFEVQGCADIPPGGGLAIVAAGFGSARFQARDSDGKVVDIPVVGSLQQAAGLGPKGLPTGKLEVSGLIRMGPINGPQWALIPVLVRAGGKAEPAFKKGALWLSARDMGLAQARPWAGAAARIISAWLLAVFAAWLLYALIGLRARGLLGWPVLGAALMGAASPWFIPMLGGPRVMALCQGLGLALLIAVAFAAFWGGKRKAWAENTGLVLMLALGPGLLAHFTAQWWQEIQRAAIIPVGHDYLTVQNLARDIVLKGDWINAKIKVYHYQPLYRYFTALFHILFGPSMFTTRIFDIWCVLGGAALTARVARGLGASVAWSLLAGGMVVCHITGDRFLFLLGLGLQEYAAMFFLMLAAACALAAGGRAWPALGAGIVAAMAELLRMDHLGAVAGVGFLQLRQAAGSLGRAWRQWLAEAMSRKAALALYLGPIAAALLAVALRNWALGDHFGLTEPWHIPFLKAKSWLSGLDSLLIVLNASEKGFSGTAPVLWAGALTALAAAVWRPAPLRGYPLGLSAAVLGLLAPYVYFQVMAYYPRWSIHLLPLAAVSAALLAHSLCRWPWLRRSLCLTRDAAIGALAGGLAARAVIGLAVSWHLQRVFIPGRNWLTIGLAALIIAALPYRPYSGQDCSRIE